MPPLLETEPAVRVSPAPFIVSAPPDPLLNAPATVTRPELLVGSNISAPELLKFASAFKPLMRPVTATLPPRLLLKSPFEVRGSGKEAVPPLLRVILPKLDTEPTVRVPNPPLIVRAKVSVPVLLSAPVTFTFALATVSVPVLLSAPLTFTAAVPPVAVREPAFFRFAPTFNVLVLPPAMPDRVTLPPALLPKSPLELSVSEVPSRVMVPLLETEPAVSVSFMLAIVSAAPDSLLSAPVTFTIETPVRIPAVLNVREPALFRFAPTFNVLPVLNRVTLPPELLSKSPLEVSVSVAVTVRVMAPLLVTEPAVRMSPVPPIVSVPALLRLPSTFNVLPKPVTATMPLELLSKSPLEVSVSAGNPGWPGPAKVMVPLLETEPAVKVSLVPFMVSMPPDSLVNAPAMFTDDEKLKLLNNREPTLSKPRFTFKLPPAAIRPEVLPMVTVSTVALMSSSTPPPLMMRTSYAAPGGVPLLGTQSKFQSDATLQASERGSVQLMTFTPGTPVHWARAAVEAREIRKPNGRAIWRKRRASAVVPRLKARSLVAGEFGSVMAFLRAAALLFPEDP